MKDLSIIILSYNTKELTLNCINSAIRNVRDVDYEIIVVDNASSDGSLSALEELSRKLKKFGNKVSTKKPVSPRELFVPELKLIKNKNNLGFSKANNQGIKIAEGRYILFLNSDTIFKDSFLREMIDWMDENPKIGIASCALENTDGSMQGTGGYFPYLWRVFAWMFFLDDLPVVDRVIKPFHPMHTQSAFYKGEKFYGKERELDWVTGAFLMVKGKVIEEIGPFDENFFMYTEDVDFCYRAKSKGWKVYYNPRWRIVHFGGASSAREFPIIKEYEMIKVFYKKHMSSWKYPLLRVFLKTGALLRVLVFGFLKGGDAARIYEKAFITA